MFGSPVYVEIETQEGTVVGRVLMEYEILPEPEALEIPPIDDPIWQTDPRYTRLLKPGVEPPTIEMK